ncbi:MAG: class I SAM-dependent methyltransferase [Candidatus Magasanikbacteria bacterium]|nr:class I SAM-dependent methyltransferase [Candidatus Magasanikbacteria bacterium]
MNILSVWREMWRGKDLYRIFMNEECFPEIIGGKVLDVGSGKTLASYHRFLKREPGTLIECLDLGFEKTDGGSQPIDLEKDTLPYAAESVDVVLFFNVLEHLYNHRLVLSEIKRVLKPGGQLIGAVPFLVSYHPDPHDYWRYTKETLQKIFTEIGFTTVQIRPFGFGPASAAFSQLEMALPRVLKIILVPGVLCVDWVITKFRPKMGKEKFSLGLFFRVV